MVMFAEQIKTLSDEKLDSQGFTLYERREIMMGSLQEINQALLLIRAEKQNRLEDKKEDKIDEVDVKKK